MHALETRWVALEIVTETRPARMTVVNDDADLLMAVRDCFADQYQVSVLCAPDSMGSIADQAPDVLVLGPLRGRGDRLGVWEVIALARSHMALHAVPIVVLSPDFDQLLAEGRQLAEYHDVYAVSMPFTVDVIEAVVASVARAAKPKDRLPSLCVHGYADGSGADACPRCATSFGDSQWESTWTR